MIKSKLPLRGTDDFGSGAFGASRGNSAHKGIDYACYPDTQILCKIEGEVTKLGYPYANAMQFRYVEVTSADKMRHRYFYVEPSVVVGNYVSRNFVVGKSQDIAGHYNTSTKTMNNHLHYEILDVDGTPIDPDIYHAT